MVESIGSVVSGLVASASRAPRADSRAAAPTDLSQGGGLQEVQSISPRLHTDPVSGVLITEYLSSSGQVKMQLPSEVAVAYLRSGLTAEGEQRQGAMLAKQEAVTGVLV